MVRQKTFTQTPTMRWRRPDSDHDCLWHHQNHQRHPPTAHLQTEDRGNQRHLHRHQTMAQRQIPKQANQHRQRSQFLRATLSSTHTTRGTTSWSTTEQHGTGTNARSGNSVTVRNSRTGDLRTTKTPVQPARNLELCTVEDKQTATARALHSSTTTKHHTSRVSKHDLPGLRAWLCC